MRLLTRVLLAVLLGSLLCGWAHAAVHADEVDGACTACQWVKHSPGGALPAPQALAALLFVALVGLSAPIARGGAAVARPIGRAPPRSA